VTALATEGKADQRRVIRRPTGKADHALLFALRGKFIRKKKGMTPTGDAPVKSCIGTLLTRTDGRGRICLDG
jgi:hypothetical protein